MLLFSNPWSSLIDLRKDEEDGFHAVDYGSLIFSNVEVLPQFY